MMFKATVLAVLVAAASAQCPEFNPETACSICGEGECITNPTAEFVFPGQPQVACAILQDAGLQGLIPLEQCVFLPPLIGACECEAPPTPAPVAPTTAPVAPAPVAPDVCPMVPAGGCNVCGDLGCVQERDPIFAFPGQPEAACGALEDAGFSGTIPLDQCGFLPGLISELCACGTPGTAAPVTAAPIDPPTAAPVDPPTASPVSPAPVTDSPVATGPVAPTPFPVFILTPQPTPTDELESEDGGGDGGMGMGMGMGGGMGMGMGDDSSDDGMSMAMKKRRLAGIRSGNSAARRGAN